MGREEKTKLEKVLEPLGSRTNMVEGNRRKELQMYSFNKYLLRTYNMPSPVLGQGAKPAALTELPSM